MNSHLHLFLFERLVWIGEGVVSFSASSDTARFFTRWRIVDTLPDEIFCTQEVELHGIQPATMNFFHFFDISDGSFKMTLENETIGKISGKGIFDERQIAWEIREKAGLEGFEVYELQLDKTYDFHAEYSTGDEVHTFIKGKIWEKN